MTKKMWMKIVKKWGEHTIGDIVLFDRSKADDLMAKGILEKAKPSKPTKKGPQAETSMATPVAETADVRPIVSSRAATEQKTDAEDKVAEADESAKTEGKSRSRFGKGKRG